MRKIITFLTCMLLLGITSGLQAQSLPNLSVEGNSFVDDSGAKVVLRGASISDPDRLEKEGQWNKSYLEELRRWGANVVRFPVHPRAWRERGESDYLNLLDEGIQWAGELGMYVIIDWHSIGNLRTELFQHEMYNTTKTETYRFWKTISSRYVGNPVVAFYELFNEPTEYNGTLGTMTWEQHKVIMEDIISIIRAHDENVITLVAGFNWAYDLSGVKYHPIAHPNVAYVSHPYPQKREQPWEPQWDEDWGYVADRYPVFVTEFGFMSADGPGAHIPVISDETYGEAIINYMENKGISWAVWVFDPHWSPQMFMTWDFIPTAQGEFFRNKMLELNR